MNHRIGSILFGLIVGVGVAIWSYQWITDSERREERKRQEEIVLHARQLLSASLDLKAPEFVDPVSPQRKVGKVYIYRADEGWEVSGYYRRNDSDKWHAYLLIMAADRSLLRVKVKDASAALKRLADANERLEVLP